MQRRVRTLNPDSLSWQEVYARLAEVVVPRPIAVVSTVDREGRANLAPFSFFTVVSSNPPYIAFSPHRSGRTGEQKDTYHNAIATGCFVVAVVDEALAPAVNASAAPLPKGASEFATAGLTPVPAVKVRASLVKESPVNLECEVVEVRDYGTGPGAGSLVVGRVVMLHLDEALLDERGCVSGERLRAVGRVGGEWWLRTLDTFLMPRPDPKTPAQG